MKKLLTIIIDDEAPARALLQAYLTDHPAIELLGSYQNGFEGLKAINELQPDLVVLDIQMPKITGFEMLELLESHPIVIFSTAYDEFAIKAFELNAIDYLLKPYSKKRLLEAIDKAVLFSKNNSDSNQQVQNLLDNLQNDTPHLERIVVKTGTKINVITTSMIHFFQAQDDYVEIVTANGKYLKQKTMKFFEQHLDPKEFVRIHRSYIVKINQIDKLELLGKDNYVLILKSGNKLKVSKTGYPRLKEVLNF